MSTWHPRSGSFAKLSSFSVAGQRKLVNVRLATIRKVGGGQVHIIGVANPFLRCKTGNKFEEQQPVGGLTGGTFVQYIEQPSARDLRELPHTKSGGQLYAEQVRMGSAVSA